MPSWIDAQFERQVTTAEAKKGHITVRAVDAPLFSAVFSPIYTEKEAMRDLRKGLHTFYRDSDGKRLLLKLVFRNPPRKELRLYFNQREGFKARAGEVIYARFSGRTASIGIRSTKIKDEAAINRKLPLARIDEIGDQINLLVHTQPKYRKLLARTVPARCVRLVEECMKNAAYICEAGFESPEFISKSTGQRYLEGHHLIPLSLQKEIRFNLDVLSNLFALSPHAHRAIHFGDEATIKGIIDTLVEKRSRILEDTGMSKQALYRIYGCGA
jgi:5-methylcytosine-specific restriction protein A